MKNYFEMIDNGRRVDEILRSNPDVLSIVGSLYDFIL